MPDLVLHGKITDVFKSSFMVLLEDDNGCLSTAYVLKSDIIPEDQQYIVVGNTIEYIIDGDKEIIHITKLRIWTQQDEENAKKRADTAIKFLDELDNA